MAAHLNKHVFLCLGLLLPALLTDAADAQQSVAANAPPTGSAVDIRIDNFTFNPPEIIVSAGTTITWTNGDDIPHTVMAVNKAFRSKVMDSEQTFSFSFSAPGTYEYFCSLHPHMTGKVIVK